MGKVLGKDHIKKELALKVTGRATFVADIHLPGMLDCKILKSPYAHAKILSIDTSEAEKLPVVADAGQAVLPPAIGAGAGLVVAEVGPGVAIGAIVLANGTPLALAQVRPPLAPGHLLLVGRQKAHNFRRFHFD